MRKQLKYSLDKQQRKIVMLSAMGGLLEFYDFIIYGIFSVYFAHQFFPGDGLLAIIESYAVFVLGYLARPLGGIIFSHVGDEHGRKKVLIITIVLMGMSSFGIGILPTYSQIGIFAPILLLVLRLIQGLAIGGELPSTYVYITETMHHKRGSGFGITMVGVNSGLLLGMLIDQLMNTTLTQAELINYGWRLPFIFGGSLCLVSYKIRKTLQETKAFQRIHDKPVFPLVYLFKNNLIQLFASASITAIMAGLVVIVLVFMPTYLHEIIKIDSKIISHIMLVTMLFNIITIYFTGKIANHISAYSILKYLLSATLIIMPASYWLIMNSLIVYGVITLGVLQGIAAMIVPLLISSLFPTKIRLTGVAVSYNIGMTIFGGLAPIIIGGFIKSGIGGIYTSPVIYLTIITIIATIGLILAKRYSMTVIHES